MGVRGRRRELGDHEEAEEVPTEYDSDDDGPPNFIPASLVESDTNDTLESLLDEYRRKSEYLRYVCPGDLRLWVARSPRYQLRNARTAPDLSEFLEHALRILEGEQDAPCSEDPPLAFPNCPRTGILGAMRYQLCEKLSKYYVTHKDHARIPSDYFLGSL